MPSSVSTAASSVTSHPGCGRGPRSVGVDWSQVDQRSPSGKPSVSSWASSAASLGRCRSRLADVASSSKYCRRLRPARRSLPYAGSKDSALSRTAAPQVGCEKDGLRAARGGRIHQGPSFRTAGREAGAYLSRVQRPIPATITATELFGRLVAAPVVAAAQVVQGALGVLLRLAHRLT